MSYIVVTRNPLNKKMIALVAGEEGEYLAEFVTEDEAMRAAKANLACRAWGAEIVPLGGLDIVE